MVKTIYGLYDAVAENIIAIQLEDNEEVARRNFKYALSQLKNSPIRPEDLCLKPLATLDMRSGNVIPDLSDDFGVIHGAVLFKELIEDGTEDASC